VARSTITRPTRTLGVLVALLAVLFGVIGAGVLWSNAQWTPELALDLRGGTQIVLKPRPTAGGSGTISQTTIDEAVKIIRNRVNGSGVAEAEVTTSGSGAKTNIIVSLPGKPDRKTEALVTQSAQLRFRAVLAAAAGAPQPAPTATGSGTATTTPSAGASAAGSASGTATAKPSGSATASAGATTSANGRAIPKALLAATGTPTTTSTTSPTATSTTATPSETPGDAASTPVTKPTDASDVNWVDEALAAKFEALDCSDKANRQGGGGDDPAKPLVGCDLDGSAKYILGPAEVIGTDVKSASYGLEVNSQGVTGTAYEVDLSFTPAGGKKFAAVTTRLAALDGVRNQFGIVLDGLVVSAPGTNEPITAGNARITGTFSLETAQTLANQLKYGALPLSFEVTTKETISATLGGEQLRRGLLAGLIGLMLVVVYSLLQYRALGLVTVASLVIAGAVTYGLVVLLGWRQGYRLSLPGVTGLIVAIGITADSFIVYFERVRDEVRDGRPLRVAVEAGWTRARRTIIASDAVSFLAAVVLYLLAVGGVRGFAFTLGLTTVVDLAVVFLFTHPMVALIARTRFFGEGHWLSGFDPEHLGRSVGYAGRGRVRTPASVSAGSTTARSSGTSSSPEPADVFATASVPAGPVTSTASSTARAAASADGSGRQTIAQRRAAAARQARSEDSDDRPNIRADDPADAEAPTVTPGRDA
jgi:preprotein translocase subunit SecD